jgi:hypothetical protein
MDWVGVEPTTLASISFQAALYNKVKALFRVKGTEKQQYTPGYISVTTKRLNATACITFGESKKKKFL